MRHLLVVPLVIFPFSCQSLPAGSMDAVSPASDSPRRGNVYLLRGWQDLYSQGVDQLATQLRQQGVRAEVFRAAQWRELAETIADRYARVPSREPLVLVGFSYGADDALLTAGYLERSRLAVDLVVTIDPVTPPPVPANVRVCYNYFQTNGMWDVLPWFRGIPLKSDGGARLSNVDIRRQRPDLLTANTSHATIAANPKLREAVVRQVLAACPLRFAPPCGG